MLKAILAGAAQILRAILNYQELHSCFGFMIVSDTTQVSTTTVNYQEPCSNLTSVKRNTNTLSKLNGLPRGTQTLRAISNFQNVTLIKIKINMTHDSDSKFISRRSICTSK
jgi:hypothetical protein